MSPSSLPLRVLVPGEYIATMSFFSLGLFNSLPEISFNQPVLCGGAQSLTCAFSLIGPHSSVPDLSGDTPTRGLKASGQFVTSAGDPRLGAGGTRAVSDLSRDPLPGDWGLGAPGQFLPPLPSHGRVHLSSQTWTCLHARWRQRGAFPWCPRLGLDIRHEGGIGTPTLLAAA